MSPKPRIVGVVYLGYFVLAFSGVFAMKGLIVPGNASATSANLLAHESAYRAGLALGLIANAFYIAVTVLFYRLFEPVNRTMALLAAFFSLVGCIVQIAAGILELAPLVLLRGSHLASAFTADQLRGLSLSSLELYSQTFNISLVLFAVFDVFLGLLIIRSRFLPPILGMLLVAAGCGWLAFLWPPLATALSPFVQILGAVAELVLMFWLIVRGAKE